MAIPVEELCDRYAALYPGAVTDSLDALGYERQTLPPAIDPLRHDMTMAGIAFPVHGRADPDLDYDANMRRFLRMLGDVPANSVIAYECNDDTAAHLGELSAFSLAERGCRGAVVDGGIRDASHMLERDFDVFCRYRTPADAIPRWTLDDWDVPIRIGSVEIRPGDVLVGDVDGVVCVPRDRAEEVLRRAEETVDTEDDVRAAIADGVDPLDAYDEYGKF